MKIDNKFYFLIIGVIGLYATFLVISDFTLIYDKISQFKTNFLPIILLVIPCSWVALFFRWNILLKNNNIKIPFKQNLKIYFAGYSLAVTPGKFGELIKTELMKNKFNISRTTSAPIILVERLYDLVGAVIVSYLGIIFLGLGIYIIIGASILLILIFTLISSRKIFCNFLNVCKKIKFTNKMLVPISDSYEVIRLSTRGRIAIVSSLLSTVFWLGESIGVYFVLLSLNIDTINYFNVVSIYTSSLVLGAISFIPGGIGVAEGSLIGLLNYQGIELPVALVLVILIRFFTLWYSVVVGFIALKLGGGFSQSRNFN